MSVMRPGCLWRGNLGQFFVYQGSTPTTLDAYVLRRDAIDEYAETIVQSRWPLLQVWRRAAQASVSHFPSCQTRAPSRAATSRSSQPPWPIIRTESGKWIAIRLLQTPVPALQQSYLRTRRTTSANFARPAIAHGYVDNTSTPIATARSPTSRNFIRSGIHASTTRTRSTAAIRRPNGRVALARRHHLDRQSEERLAAEHQQLAVLGAGSESPRRETTRATVATGENPRGLHAWKCCTTSTSDARTRSPPATTAPDHVDVCCRAHRRYDHCRPRIRARPTEGAGRAPATLGPSVSEDRGTSVAIFWGERSSITIDRRLCLRRAGVSYLTDGVTTRTPRRARAALDRLRKDWQ